MKQDKNFLWNKQDVEGAPFCQKSSDESSSFSFMSQPLWRTSRVKCVFVCIQYKAGRNKIPQDSSGVRNKEEHVLCGRLVPSFLSQSLVSHLLASLSETRMSMKRIRAVLNSLPTIQSAMHSSRSTKRLKNVSIHVCTAFDATHGPPCVHTHGGPCTSPYCE